MRRATSGFLFALCVCFAGCGTSPSPDEQFKAIVDAKRIQMDKWLSSSKPDLVQAIRDFAKLPHFSMAVVGAVTEEKNVDSRIDHLYTGTIKVGFPTVVREDGWKGCSMLAIYLYSSKDRAWHYNGIFRDQNCEIPEDAAITYEEIEKAFEKK